MADTHIVAIHGLAPKPPPVILAARYRRYLAESTEREIPADRFHSAYWADLMLDDDGNPRQELTPETDEYAEGGTNFMPYSFFEQIEFGLTGLLRSHAVGVLEDLISSALTDEESAAAGVAQMIDSLPGVLAGEPAEYLYGYLLPDMHQYFFGGGKDAVRGRLRAQLAAVPDGSPVCLIAHSMGSIIAADLIVNELLADDKDLPIDAFITIGSPLGLRVVQQQIGVTDVVLQRLSEKSMHWFNLYDRRDVVALDSDLADDFSPVPILDIRIRNEFVNKDDDRNHHKSYGYLRSPEMGELVATLL